MLLRRGSRAAGGGDGVPARFRMRGSDALGLAAYAAVAFLPYAPPPHHLPARHGASPSTTTHTRLGSLALFAIAICTPFLPPITHHFSVARAARTPLCLDYRPLPCLPAGCWREGVTFADERCDCDGSVTSHVLL